MDFEGKDPKISIAAGIVIGLVASCVQSLGLTIQRKSHVLNQALPESEQRVEHRRPLWLLGFGIFFSSNVLGSLFQIASLPVVILAPLGAVSLLWNALFARFLLGDVFSPWMILGTLLIAGGAVLIAIFGIVPEPTHSLEDLLQLFRRPAFVAYFSLLGAVVVVCLAITHIMEYSYARRPIALPLTPPMSPLVDITSNDLTNGNNERTPLLERERLRSPSPTPTASTIVLSTPKPSRAAMFIAISYASFSGILSGMCLIFAKSGVELLLLTVSGHNQFWRWESWMLALGLGIFALLQLWYLHKSLVLADPTLVCPLAFCFYNLSSIFNGLVYYDQFSLLPTKYLILVLVGIVILLAGVWVVSVPANGGGVEVGTWQEGDEDFVDGPIRLDSEAGQGLGLHVGGDDGRGRSGHDRRGISLNNMAGSGDWSSLAEPRPAPTADEQQDISLLDARSPEPFPPSPTGHGRHPTDPALVSPPRALRRRAGTQLALGADGSPSRLRHPHGPHVYSPPLSTASLGGFSIGLSPASPGFSVLPRERRRRVSGMGFVDVVEQARAAEVGAIRRTLSEGDSARALADGEAGDHEAHADAATQEPPSTEPSPPTEHNADDGSKFKTGRARWRWLGSVFGGRRHGE